jgi:hypothetical protein
MNEVFVELGGAMCSIRTVIREASSDQQVNIVSSCYPQLESTFSPFLW